MYESWHRQHLWQIARESSGVLERISQRLTTVNAVHAHVDCVRRRLWDQLGGRPAQPCDLNAQITGTFQSTGYRIEKILFQSQPQFLVSGHLYVPNALTAPAPAVLGLVGHNFQAKATADYQILAVNLALRGFVVLMIDPIGQGERGPYYSYYHGDAQGNSHDFQGFQCYLTGRPLAFHFLWDSIRALDYLCSRPEIDSTRIGCTGCSGGGTQTAHLAAVDERIAALAPVCSAGWPFDVFTSWMMHPEGNFIDIFSEDGPNALNLGICAAPRAQLLISGSEDHLLCSGIHRLAGHLSPVYAALAQPSRIDCFTAVEHHALSRPMRCAIYDWMDRHLRAKTNIDAANEIAIDALSEEQLSVTPHRDVQKSGSINVHRLNVIEADRLTDLQRPHPSLSEAGEALEKILLPRETTAVSYIVSSADAIRGGGLDSETPPVQIDGAGLLHQRLVCTAPPQSVPVQPFNEYLPAKSIPGNSEELVLFVCDFGYPECGEFILAAMRSGKRLVAGELRPTDHQRLLLLGITPAGYYLQIWRRILQSSLNSSATRLRIVAQGPLASLMTAAIATDHDRILSNVCMIDSFVDWRDALRDPRFSLPEVQTTFGLMKYDWAGLLRLFGRRLSLVNPRHRDAHLLSPLSVHQIPSANIYAELAGWLIS